MSSPAKESFDYLEEERKDFRVFLSDADRRLGCRWPDTPRYSQLLRVQSALGCFQGPRGALYRRL